MKTLWPRTEPLLAEAIEPSRYDGMGRGSGNLVAGPSPLTVRRPARPVAPAHRPRRVPLAAAGATLTLGLLAGWLRVLATGGWMRATTLRVRHVPKFDQIDPGAAGAPHHSTLRPPPTVVSAAGRRRAVPARVPEEGFHVRRDRSGGPPGLRRAGCRVAAGAGRGRAGPERGRRGRCGHRSQAAAPRFARWSQSAPADIGRPGLG